MVDGLLLRIYEYTTVLVALTAIDNVVHILTSSETHKTQNPPSHVGTNRRTAISLSNPVEFTKNTHSREHLAFAHALHAAGKTSTPTEASSTRGDGEVFLPQERLPANTTNLFFRGVVGAG